MPIDGGLPTPLGPIGSVVSFAISPDSAVVIYKATSATGVTELFSVPIGGGEPTKLSFHLSIGEDVAGFVPSPDGATVVYTAGVTTGSQTLTVFSVPITGGPSMRLSNGDDNVLEYRLSPDGTMVVIRNSDGGLYSVPIGGGPRVLLNNAQGPSIFVFTITADSATVIFRDVDDTPLTLELHSVPIGGGTITKLNGPLVAGGDVMGFSSSQDGSMVVYSADQDTDGIVEVYAVPITGGTPTKLNGPLVAGGDARVGRITLDGTTVIYPADQDVNNMIELYSVPIGGGTSVKVNVPLGAAEDVYQTELSPDGSILVYRAGDDDEQFFELYSIPVNVDADGIDRDGDGFGAPCDCSDSNQTCTTDCTDSDADDVCVTNDCDDTNGSAWFQPSALDDLWLRKIEGATLLTWAKPQSPGADSVRYDVVRSTLATDFVAGATCLESDETDRNAQDAELPSSSGVSHYLVRVENDCPGDGAVGPASDGTQRATLLCP